MKKDSYPNFKLILLKLSLGIFFLILALNSSLAIAKPINKIFGQGASQDKLLSPIIPIPSNHIRIHGKFAILFPLERLDIKNSRLLINVKLEPPHIKNAPPSVDPKALRLTVKEISVPNNGKGNFTIDFPKMKIEDLVKLIPELEKSDSANVQLQFRLCEKARSNCNDQGFFGTGKKKPEETKIAWATANRNIPISHFTDRRPHELNWGQTMLAQYFNKHAPSLEECQKNPQPITGTIFGYNGFFEKIPKGKKAYVMAKPVAFQHYINYWEQDRTKKLDGYSKPLVVTQNSAKFSVMPGSSNLSNLINLIIFFCSPSEAFDECAYQASNARKALTYAPQLYSLLFTKNSEAASCGSRNLTVYAYGGVGDLSAKSQIKANELEKGVPDEIFIADPNSPE